MWDFPGVYELELLTRVRLSSAEGWTRPNSAELGWTRPNSAELGWTRLNSFRRSSSRRSWGFAQLALLRRSDSSGDISFRGRVSMVLLCSVSRIRKAGFPQVRPAFRQRRNYQRFPPLFRDAGTGPKYSLSVLKRSLCALSDVKVHSHTQRLHQRETHIL